jgi:hypothetical protein
MLNVVNELFAKVEKVSGYLRIWRGNYFLAGIFTAKIILPQRAQGFRPQRTQRTQSNPARFENVSSVIANAVLSEP